MLAAHLVRHVHFGDLHSASHLQPLSSSEAFEYCGSMLDWREYHFLGTTMPKYLNSMQELRVDQGVCGDFPIHEDYNGSQDEAASEVPGTKDPVSSPRQASACRLMSSVGTDRVASADVASEAAMVEAKCPWYTAEHVRYQSIMDFKEKILRKRSISANEHTFAEWVWPPSDRNAQEMYQEDGIRQSTDATLDFLGELPFKFGESRAGVSAQSRPKYMSKEEYGGKATPSTSAPKVSQAEPSKPRLTQREGTAVTRVNSWPAAGPMSGRTGEAATDTKRRREKLTIEQKRRNHIRHEKKRRRLIKDGFDDLTELIPELRGRTVSRSTILFRATDWLEKLIQENKALMAQVSELESEKTVSLAGTSTVETPY